MLEALLDAVNYDLDRGQTILRCEHEDDKPHQLIVETTLKDLSHLTQQDRYKEALTTEQIRAALNAHMKDFLGILTDNRSQRRGLPEWRFTLILWSENKERNLEEFEREWERRRPVKGKEQEIERSNSPPSIDDRFKGRILSPIPHLPPYFVARSQEERELKNILLTTSAVLAIGAIQGLGGIGKTTLATALVLDPEIRSRFPDGILWTTLGREPDVLSLLSRWILALGDYDFKATTVETTSTHLHRLLSDKTILLVIDDAWDSKHIEPFLVGSPQCRALVTTRRLYVVEEVKADTYSLDLMTPEQSLELLSKCLNRPLEETEREDAQGLADAVGYLPLALELAGKRIARGVRWADLRTALEAEIAALEKLDGSHRRRKNEMTLAASFNLSLKALREEEDGVWKSFIWLGVLPEDVTITAPMAATLWQVDAEEADEQLEWLWEEALLLPSSSQAIGERTWRAYRLHDLLHDLARGLLTGSPNPSRRNVLPGLGLDLRSAHATLLERYRATIPNGLWHNLIDDGYIHSHLTWHLEKAGHPLALHQLLQEETSAGRNGWYEARDRLGQMAGFVTDVARAWRLAEVGFEENPADSIGWQCRYALIMSSLNTVAANIPPELMAALVEKGIWSPAQGLAYAQQVQDSFRRAQALSGLAAHLPSSLLPEALEAARVIDHEYGRAFALSGLAAHLPSSLLPEALEAARIIDHEYGRAFALSGLAPHLHDILPEALEAARAIDHESSRASALSGLAPHLPESLLPEALESARAIDHESYRASALSGLAPHLPESLLPEALESARAIKNQYHRVSTLGGLVAHLPSSLLSEALESVRAIDHEYVRALALSGLAPHLPESLLPEALESARAIKNQSSRAEALGRLAPHLPSSLLPEALEAARAIKNQSSRASALSGLAPHLPESLLSEALESARAISDESSRASALSGLAPHLPESLLSEALDAVRAISDESSRASPLSRLAPHLPESLLSEALEAACAINHEYCRALALSGLAAHLPSSLLPEALEAARAISNESSRASALSGLAPHLPSSLLPEALEAARAISSGSSRASALSGLAPHLPHILPEALEAARAIDHEYYRALALSGLAAHLPSSLLPEALEAARAIDHEYCRALALSGLAAHLPDILPEVLEAARAISDESSRAEALSGLAAHLPSSLLPEALETARDIDDEECRASALSGLAPHLPSSLLPEALEAARAISSGSSRASVLSGLAPHLPSSLLPEALEAALAIKYESSRASALSGLAPHLPSSLLPEALGAARAISDERHRASALSGLAPHLPESTNELAFWCEILSVLSCCQRKDFLTDLVKLDRVILALGGTEALRQAVRGIQDVCRQWK